MKKILLNFTLLIVFSVISALSFAQYSVKGTVVDAKTNESLIGATVVVEGVTGGTVTDIDGNFMLNIPSGDHNIIISFVGYLTKTVAVTSSTADLGTITMEESAIGIAEVGIIASVAIDRQTPVAVSSIKPEIIAEKLGTQEFPEILKSTPSMYVTRSGGGYGDSRLNLRGFDSRNVAVMINGVPVNDMESGWVYWSNWAGLSDATRSMQVQRGLGASKVAVPSVGGTVNILTKTTDAEKGGVINLGVGNDGYERWGIALSSGLTEKNWAFAFSLGHTTGKGYVEGTDFDAWSYYLGISKQVNPNHRLAFSMFGAPQWHGQRSTRLTIETFDRVNQGIKYNPDWGYQNGQVQYLRKNYYHKPQAILNHFWTVSSKTSVITAFYASLGTGGGTGSLGNTGKFSSYLTADAQIDFDRIIAENIALGARGSDAIIRTSANNHNWYGFISTLNHKFTDNLTLNFGLDFRSYVGQHYQEIVDLLGGSYYVSTTDKSAGTVLAKVGDKVGYWNDGIVGWAGTFAQLEYTNGKLSAFVAGAASNMSMQRKDYFIYATDSLSEKLNYFGYSGKGGVNYNLTDHHNVFVNAGYFQRQPDFRNAFVNNTNTPNPNGENEKITSMELGYGFRKSNLSVNFNAYYTIWADKSFVKTYSLPDLSILSANLQGVDARHMGLELDFVYSPIKKLTITGMASLGNWMWLNNLEDVKIYDESQNEVATVNLFLKDVKVGDAAQTTAAFGINYDLLKNLKVGVDYNYYADLFANFDALKRGTAPAEGEVNPNSWEMPVYQLIDVNLRYSFDMKGFKSSVYANVNNLLNVEYIADATDGTSHTWNTASVYYGVGRTWSFGLKVTF